MAAQRHHNGMVYTDLNKLIIPVTATMAINDTEKLSMKNVDFSVEVTAGSYKYGDDEVVFSAWGYDYPTVEERPRNKGYARNELVYHGSLRTVYDWFESATMKLDAKLKGL